MSVGVVRGLAATLAFVFLASFAAPARAQVLTYRFSDTSTGAATHGIVDLATGAGRSATAGEAQVDAVFTSDGLYGVTTAPGAVVVRHMPTGALTTVPVDFVPVLSHPRRPMLFGYTAGSALARLDPRGLAAWTPCPAAAGVTSFDLSLDGSQVFVACGTDEVLVLDSETGVELRRVPGVPVIRFVAVNAAGELVVAHAALGGDEVVRLDAGSGQVLARRVSLDGWDRTTSRRQLLEFHPSTTPGVPAIYRLVDTSTLAVSLVLPATLTTAARAFVSPDGRETVFSSAGDSVSTPSRVTRLDVATGSVLNDVVMPPGQRVDVNVVPVPLPPASPTVAVAGTDVTLSWRLPAESPQATGYWLDLGTAPGATNLGSYYLGAAETFHAAGAPLGRFFMRLRAVNQAGSSLPSVEFVLNLPPLD